MTYLYRLWAVMLTSMLFASITHAGSCDQSYSIGDQIQDSWDNSCMSEHYQSYDPYNPQYYYGKFFQFTLDRDADVVFSSTGYGYMFLIAGTNKSASAFVTGYNNELKTHLIAGDYILEYAASYSSSFTLTSRYNDTGSLTCLTSIDFGTPVSDGWVPTCTSESRDIADPYSPVPDQGFRAKYFTFTLAQDSDISIAVASEVSPYIYILEGDTQFGAIKRELSSRAGNLYLTAGTYTIELTTASRYDPGQFTITLNQLQSSSNCTTALTLGDTISDSWAPDCTIASWMDGNSDPYAGQNPERAKYYSFTLSEASDVRFTLAAGNSSATILNLYNAGEYGSALATTKSSYWSSNGTVISKRLPAGSYELEVTQFDRIAIGSFSVETQVLTSDCNVSVSYSGSTITTDARLSDNCLSEFRGADGNFDPYGVQAGTYYAKRFEFTLDKTTLLNLRASGLQDNYLYLAKKGELDNLLLTESYQASYYSATRAPSIRRELAPGTYIAEVTSYYPNRNFDVSFTLSPAYSSCDLSLTLNKYKAGTLTSDCKAKMKDSVANPDPYSYPSTYYYYGKRYTFEVTEAGTYEISSDSSNVGSHVFLLRGGDYKGEYVDDFYGSSGNVSRDYTLSPGIYTLEVTSSQANEIGSFSLLVWDKTTDLTDECHLAVDLTTSNTTYDGFLPSACVGSQLGSSYRYMHYDFTLGDDNSKLSVELTPSFSYPSLYLLKYENQAWSRINTFYSYHSIVTAVLTAGQYRLEVTSWFNDLTFSLALAKIVDSDGDGIYDNEDAFPNDPNETRDSDGDGVGNNTDTFPYDGSETVDTDGDGVGDNADVFPYNVNETIDSDGDGIGDVADQDDDNDGVADVLDSVPTDSTVGVSTLFDISGTLSSTEDHQLVVTLTRALPAVAATYRYYTYDETAIANNDYVPAVGNIDFADQQASQSIAIDLLQDDVAEGDETLKLVVVTGSDTQVIDLTIQDSVPEDAVSLEQSTYLVSEAQSEAVVKVVRRGNTDAALNFYFRTIDGSAVALQDYVPVSGQIEFASGETEKLIHVPLIKDNEEEGAEYLMVQLLDTEHNGKLFGNFVATIQFVAEVEANIDDSIGYAFAMTNLDGVPASKLNNVRQVVLTRTGDLTQEASVRFNVSINYGYISDTSPVDATFAAGSAIAYADVVIYGGSYTMGTVSFALVSATPEGVLAGNIEWKVTPYAGSLYGSGFVFSNGENTKIVPESQSSRITVIRPFDRSVWDYSLTKLTDNGVLQSVADNTFTLDAATNQYSALLTPIDDHVYQGYRDASFRVGNSYLYLYVLDEEDLAQKGTLAFSAEQVTVQETDAYTGAIIQRLYGDVGEINATLRTRDGTAVAGVNYKATEEVITLANGETALPVPLNIIDDGVATDNLYFYVDLLVQLDGNKSTTATLKVNIINVTPAAPAAEESSQSKGEKSLLESAGYFSLAWAAFLLLPLLFGRVRFIRK